MWASRSVLLMAYYEKQIGCLGMYFTTQPAPQSASHELFPMILLSEQRLQLLVDGPARSHKDNLKRSRVIIDSIDAAIVSHSKRSKSVEVKVERMSR